MPKSRKRRSSGRRAKPGARGSGGFFHIQVRPKSDFVSFRNQDVGARGGIERVAGRRANGSWDTQKWLIGKSEAHRAGKRLEPDTAAAPGYGRSRRCRARPVWRAARSCGVCGISAWQTPDCADGYKTQAEHKFRNLTLI